MATQPVNQPIQQINPDFEQARAWFNNMEPQSRNSMILTLYKLCINIKDTSHEKLAEIINAQWNEKFLKQEEIVKNLAKENEILTKTNSIQIVDKLKDLELSVINTMNGISQKISPSSNGKFGEDYIDNLLGKIPNAKLTNITQDKGCGDFLFETGEYRIMIESKNWTNSSIKGNPREIESFKETAIKAAEDDLIDFAIMALHRVTDLKGRPLEIEIEYTKKGTLMLIYVTNLFNHPERLLYAIDAGILLFSQQSKQQVNIDKFFYQINTFIRCIANMESSIKERNKQVRDINALIKKDSDYLSQMRDILENILSNGDHVPIRERVLGYCAELISEFGETKVTKTMLENKCLVNKIPARYVREIGGIKAIKKLSLALFEDENFKYKFSIKNTEQKSGDSNEESEEECNEEECNEEECNEEECNEEECSEEECSEEEDNSEKPKETVPNNFAGFRPTPGIPLDKNQLRQLQMAQKELEQQQFVQKQMEQQRKHFGSTVLC